MVSRIPTIKVDAAVALFENKSALCRYLLLTPSALSNRIARGNDDLTLKDALLVALEFPMEVEWIEKPNM